MERGLSVVRRSLEARQPPMNVQYSMSRDVRVKTKQNRNIANDKTRRGSFYRDA